MKSITRDEISTLSSSELVSELISRGVRVVSPDAFLRALTTCPHCGHVGPVHQDFGVRTLRGEVRPQSWCRTCRSKRVH